MFNFWNKSKELDNSIRPALGSKSGAGFTLVEIIVVLVIIGLLMSIMMVSTGQSRRKGKDAAIQSALMEVRNAAELYYDEAKTYVGVCDSGDNTLADTGDFKRIEDFIIQQGGIITCRQEEKAYAVVSTLNLGNCWCIDSQGDSRKITLLPGETCRAKLPATVCPL